MDHLALLQWGIAFGLKGVNDLTDHIKVDQLFKKANKFGLVSFIVYYEKINFKIVEEYY